MTMTMIENIDIFLATHCASRCLDDAADRHAVAETLVVLQAFIPQVDGIRRAIRDSLELVLRAHMSHGHLTPEEVARMLEFADEISRNGAQSVLAELS